MPIKPVDTSGIKDPAMAATMAALHDTTNEAFADIEEMTVHYLAAVYFTDTGGDDQPDSDAELSYDSKLKATAECAMFLADVAAADLLDRYIKAGGDVAQMGHDFWLTRNGLGAGFWDRDNLEESVGMVNGRAETLGERLTTMALAAKPRDVYLGDDNKLWIG